MSNCKTKALSSSVGKRIPRRIRSLLNYTIPDNYEGEITNHSLETIDRMNFVRVRDIRRRNYSMYLKLFDDMEVPFKDLGETISPWVFPFISKEKVFKSRTWANRKDVVILSVDKGCGLNERKRT